MIRLVCRKTCASLKFSAETKIEDTELLVTEKYEFQGRDETL